MAQRWTIDRFLPLYLEAAENGTTKEEFAEKLGIKPETVYQRAYALRRQGVDIPLLKSKGKLPMVEQAKKALDEYRSQKAKPARPEVVKADKRKGEDKADPNAVLTEDAAASLESILGLN